VKLFVYRNGKGYIRIDATASEINRVMTGCFAALVPYRVKLCRRGCLTSSFGGSVVLGQG
jgi:hypothetical protein